MAGRYTRQEVMSMNRLELTDAINRQACLLLENERVATRSLLPMGGDEPDNPYAEALLVDVPGDLYQPENVWSRHGQRIEFQPWLWRLGTTKAINCYAKQYAQRHGPDSFPLHEFTMQRRRLGNRVHKRHQRQKPV